MAITYEKYNCETFGQCVKISNGLVDLAVTLDFGPRVISFASTGMENMFYNDLEKLPIGKGFDIYGGDVFRLYGGHRLWVSPEVNPRCYHPDNKPVTFKKVKNGGLFTAAEESVNGLTKSMKITLDPEAPLVMIEHSIQNTGVWDKEISLWSITMLDKGGREIMPMPTAKTGLLPNRNFTFWEYTDLRDKRLYLGTKYLALDQNDKAAAPLKIGFNNEEGWAAYFNKGQVFIKAFDYDGFMVYPDGGCNYETYTNNTMLEMESLSPLAVLSPGDTATHMEHWTIYPYAETPSLKEKEIEKIMDEYIENIETGE